jgi:hypothetical protein
MIKTITRLPRRTEVIVEQFSWGALRRIHVGHSFSVIIHPEHFELIEKLHECDQLTFTDETNSGWHVTRQDGLITFAGRCGSRGNKVTVPFSTLA